MSTDSPSEPTNHTESRSNGKAHATLALALALIVVVGLAYGVVETLTQAMALF